MYLDVLQWIATIVNVVRAGQRLESAEPLTVRRCCDVHSNSRSV